MTAFSKIEFGQADYFINQKPLLMHLHQHENVSLGYIPAFIGSGSLAHLTLSKKPDLEASITALYLCGHCGGYDGTLIGGRITILPDAITWDKLGFYCDYADAKNPPTLFSKVTSNHFDKSQYFDFIETAKIHETPYYG